MLQDVLELRLCPSLTSVDLSYNNLCLQGSLLPSSCTQPESDGFSESVMDSRSKLFLMNIMKQRASEGTESTSSKSMQFAGGDQTTQGAEMHQTRLKLPPAVPDGKPLDAVVAASGTIPAIETAGVGFVDCFRSLPQLASLYLIGNPITKQIAQYRRTMIACKNGNRT